MATGGVFQLISNDGAQDNLLLATRKLSERLANIRVGKKTNIVNKVRELTTDKRFLEEQYAKQTDLNARSEIMEEINNYNDRIVGLENTLASGDSFAFSPTLGDIQKTHVHFLTTTFKPFVAIGYEYSKTLPKSAGKPAVGGTATFTVSQYGEFFSDMVLHVVLKNLLPTNPVNRVKYCEFLGHRLCKNTKFSINNNVLDEYSTEELNNYYKWYVPPNKKNGWKKCMGQEIPKTGYITQDPTNNEFRELRMVADGPQTLKSSHDSVELFIPLIFWFKDPRLAIPNAVIPFGQTDIRVDFGTKDEIAAFADYASDDSGFTTPTMESVELYVNHIYVNPDIHAIYLNRVGFTLIRVHRRQEIIIDKSHEHVRLHQMKFPVETMFVSVRPLDNFNSIDTWNKNCIVTNNLVPSPVVFDSGGVDTLGINNMQYYSVAPVINTLSLKAQDIDIYDTKSATYYNSYLPLRYGRTTLNTPEEECDYMIPFNLYPGAYQPSGYLNTSNTRELDLVYTSSTLGPAQQAKMFVIGICLNFLIVTEGTAVLRYAT